jgi:sugar phosphate isomerase/epimerase
VPGDIRDIPLSIHQLTLLDVEPEELVDIAAELSCNHLCLFLELPGGENHFPRVRSVQHAHQLRRRLDDNGVSVFNTDTFLVTPTTDFKRYEPMVEIAAAVGAQVIDVMCHHPDFARAAEIIANFTRLVRSYGLRTLMEPTPRTTTKTLDDAVKVLSLVDDPSLTLNVDILHLMRSGQQLSDLARIDPSCWYYAQISDGPPHVPVELQKAESSENRMIPGEGQFPLVEFVRMLPPNGVLSVEVPLMRFQAELPPRARARRAVEGARSVLAAAAASDVAL